MKTRLALLVLVLFSRLLVTAVSAQDESGDILGRINGLRASLGLPGYNFNGALMAAAQQQAQWIVDTGSVSHTHPDGSGPRTRALNAGYPTTDVSENIYGGTMASADIAWTFWVNSGVHYNGIVNRRYSDVGVGIARGAWGTAYVTVFGNPGGPVFIAAASGGGGGNNAASAPAAPPSFVVGQDEFGNIMHEVQPGDTLGDIALIYGYTWDDIPYMMQLNAMDDVREMEVGSIFLVPPQAGTFTPTPGEPETTPTPEPDNGPTDTPEASPSPVPSPTPWHVATAGAAPDMLLAGASTATEAPVLIAALPTKMKTPVAAVPVPAVTITRSGQSPWLIAALVVQVGILVLAGVEFFRRSRRKK